MRIATPYTSFNFFALVVCAALVLPVLFTAGMFMDGQIYATVSHNLALGKGSFWDPTFSSTYMTSYHEQPPLLFGIESLFFRVLGDSMYVERIYSLVTALLAAWGIMRIWKLLHPRDVATHAISSWPVLLWLVMPVVFWAYPSHVEEGTMVVFTLLGTELQLRALIRHGSWINFVLAGAALLAAGMCKGLQGMFPLVLAPLLLIITKEISWKRAIGGALITTVTAAGILAMLLIMPAARESFAKYYHDRIEATFQLSSTATTGNRLYLLGELGMNLLPALGMAALVLLRKKIVSVRRAIFFAALGFCGTLPLLVTHEQRGFYLVTALPFFAIAIGLLSGNALAQRLAHFRMHRWLRYGSLVLLTGVLVTTVCLAGKPRRDADMLHDVDLIGKTVGHDAVVSVPADVYKTWGLQAYFARFYNIALTPEPGRAYVLIDAKAAKDSVPEGYALVPLPTHSYRLYAPIK